MSFSNTTSRTSAVGSGAVGQDVPFSFKVNNTSDIVCYSRVTATGVESTLTETTNYTVVINGDSGGTVTTVTAIETTETIHVVRATPKTQTLNLTQGGSFSAEDQEDAFDKQTMIAIDAHDKSDRSLRFPETDPTSSIADLPNSVDRAGYVLGFDSVTGEPEAVEVDNIAPAVLGTTHKLLSSTTVSFAADANTTVYTVPANARLVIDHLVIIVADDAGATTTLSCGQNGATTDFVSAQTLSNLDAAYDAVIVRPAINTTPVKLKSYAAATVIEVTVASNSGAAGNTVLLYGTLYSA